MTNFVIKNILSELEIDPTSIIVDVGCGDCTLFKQLLADNLGRFRGRLIGILPTAEEILRVHEDILNDPNMKSSSIAFQRGTVDKINLPDSFCDVLVVNSVLHGAAKNKHEAHIALTELVRIIKPGGFLYIGELPSKDEFAGRNYNNNSIFSWLIWVFKNRGPAAFKSNLFYFLKCAVSKEPFIIEPKDRFHVAPNDFVEMMKFYSMTNLEHYPHRQIGADKIPNESTTRWNYVFRKNSDLLI